MSDKKSQTVIHPTLLAFYFKKIDGTIQQAQFFLWYFIAILLIHSFLSMFGITFHIPVGIEGCLFFFSFWGVGISGIILCLIHIRRLKTRKQNLEMDNHIR